MDSTWNLWGRVKSSVLISNPDADQCWSILIRTDQFWENCSALIGADQNLWGREKYWIELGFVIPILSNLPWLILIHLFNKYWVSKGQESFPYRAHLRPPPCSLDPMTPLLKEFLIPIIHLELLRWSQQCSQRLKEVPQSRSGTTCEACSIPKNVCS